MCRILGHTPPPPRYAYHWGSRCLFVCTRCLQTVDDTVNNHDWDQVDWIGDGCRRFRTCKSCGATDTRGFEHHFTAFVYVGETSCDKTATCTSCGKQELRTYHEWSPTGSDAGCTRCGHTPPPEPPPSEFDGYCEICGVMSSASIVSTADVERLTPRLRNFQTDDGTSASSGQVPANAAAGPRARSVHEARGWFSHFARLLVGCYRSDAAPYRSRPSSPNASSYGPHRARCCSGGRPGSCCLPDRQPTCLIRVSPSFRQVRRGLA